MSSRRIKPRIITGETPAEFRTKQHHWHIYPRHGIVRRTFLKADDTGFQLIPGGVDFELNLKQLQEERPDIMQYLKTLIDVWSQGGPGKLHG